MAFLIDMFLKELHDSRSLCFAAMLMEWGDQRKFKTLERAEIEYVTGFGLAQSELGYCYYYSEGVELDREKAVLWFERASNNNDPFGLYRLGSCYEHGNGGLNNDKEKALLLYERAAYLGCRDAQYW